MDKLEIGSDQPDKNGLYRRRARQRPANTPPQTLRQAALLLLHTPLRHAIFMFHAIFAGNG